MPHHKAFVKSLQREQAQRRINGARKSECRTLEKKFRRLIAEGHVDEARQVYVHLQKRFDQARSDGLYKRNMVSRKKSRLMKALNSTTV